MGGLKVVNGKIMKEKGGVFVHPVTIVCNHGTRSLQLIAAKLAIGVKSINPDGSPQYAGPTLALWEQLKTQYHQELADMSYVGTLASAPDGPFMHKVDWVESVDGMSLHQVDARVQAHVEGRDDAPHEPVQVIKLPKELTEDSPFVQTMMHDTELQQDILHGKGGPDLIAAVLRSAVRLSRLNK